MRDAAALASLTLLAGTALAHEGEVHATLGETLWRWTWDPLVLSLLALSAGLYVAGMRRSGRALRWWHIAAFAGGWLTLVIALVSPVDALSDLLFSAHMTQHELLMLVAAPLLVAGQPLVSMMNGLPARVRPSVVRAFRTPAVSRTWQFLTNAVNVWIIHAVVILGWHIPVFYEAAIRSEAIHFVQHFCFLASAIFFWWALVHGRYGKLGYGLGVMYVFTTAMYTGALGALVTLAPRLLYPIYGPRSAAVGIDPLHDQQLAGLIMWIPAGVIFVLVGLALFAAWLGALEQRAGLSATAARANDAEGEA